MSKVTPTLVVESVQRIAFNDERIVARNGDYEINIRVLNPEYQGFYEKGELMLDPDEVDALQAKFEDIEGDEEQSIVIEGLKEAVHAHVSTITSQGSTIADLESKVSILNSQVGSAGSIITSLRSTITAQESTIADLNSQLTSANDQIAALQAKLDKATKASKS